jgi:hypothetical protein
MPVSEKPSTTRWQHDVKNQLGIVLGYSELLLQDLEESHPMRADVVEILKAAQAAMELVKQLDQPDV